VEDKVREEHRTALQQKLVTLRAKKANGTLSAEEEKQLDRLEQASRSWQKQGSPDKSPDSSSR
jgi:3-dehydroquinate dehydratase